jgi:hypothetical protein
MAFRFRVNRGRCYNLRPVWIAASASALPQFGLVAEQVLKIDPDLVARDNNGQPYTAPDEAVNRRGAIGLLEINIDTAVSGPSDSAPSTDQKL